MSRHLTTALPTGHSREQSPLWARLRRYAPVLHYAVGGHPWLFFPLFRLREPHRAHLAVGPETDLVLEGFPRSSNTFAETALKSAQPGPLRTADHVHVPAQVIRGVKLGKPVVVLVRQPFDVVRSTAVKFPALHVPDVLRGYARFYERCLPWRRGFVVATFEQVTNDFGAVIERINRRFGLALHPFEHTEENVAAVYRQIDERNRIAPSSMYSAIERPRDTLTAARPSRLKDEAKAAIEIDADPALIDRCISVYRSYSAMAEEDK